MEGFPATVRGKGAESRGELGDGGHPKHATAATRCRAVLAMTCATISLVTEPIGGRIALHRRRRGLSQAAVAGLVGRSESWLSQVERGLRPVDSYTVLRDLARVLRVDIGTLAGNVTATQPGRPGRDADVVAIERALLACGPAEPVVDVSTSVADLHRAYQAARYDDVLAALPGLITALDGRTRRLPRPATPSWRRR